MDRELRLPLGLKRFADAKLVSRRSSPSNTEAAAQVLRFSPGVRST